LQSGGDYRSRQSGGYAGEFESGYGPSEGGDYGRPQMRGYESAGSAGWDPESGYDQWQERGTRLGYGPSHRGRSRLEEELAERDRWSSHRYGGSERGYTEAGRGYGQGGRGFWDKASDEVASWFGDEDAGQRRDMDRYRGRGPKNYVRSDERIRDDINDRLTDDGYVDASDIEVTVANREVTLSGMVDSRMAKRRAEDIAEGISGVSNVQNNLRVRQESGGSSYSSSTTTGSSAGSTTSSARTKGSGI